MRLKLDENLPHDLADELTRRGLDVDAVLDEQLGGRKDPVVVQAASDAGRLVITLDRGIGDIRAFPPGTHAGVLVLRPVSQNPVSILALLDRLLDAHARRVQPLRNDRRTATRTYPSAGRSGAAMIPEGAVERVQRWADGRVPDHVRDQVRIELDVTDRTITILECRPPWHPDMGDEWTRFAVARLRYTKTWDDCSCGRSWPRDNHGFGCWAYLVATHDCPRSGSEQPRWRDAPAT